jgi:hypothetical protein
MSKPFIVLSFSLHLHLNQFCITVPSVVFCTFMVVDVVIIFTWQVTHSPRFVCCTESNMRNGQLAPNNWDRTNKCFLASVMSLEECQMSYSLYHVPQHVGQSFHHYNGASVPLHDQRAQIRGGPSDSSFAVSCTVFPQQARWVLHRWTATSVCF